MKNFFAKLLSGLFVLVVLFGIMPYQLAQAAAGQLDTTFNSAGSGANGAVYIVMRQPDGKILLGGNFTSYNGDGYAPDRILRLNADGSLDKTFNYGSGARGADDEVWAITLQPDKKILIGGYFTSYNGVGSMPKYLLRLNPDGSVDSSFNNSGSGPNFAVTALALQTTDNFILVGGNFSLYNGLQSPDRIMRLTTNGSLDPTFNAGSGERGANGIVSTILVQPDHNILIGGGFNSYNGIANIRHHLLRLTTNGSLDTTFTGSGTEASADVRALMRQPDGKILVGGYFTTYNGVSVPNSVIRVNPDGTLDNTFNPGGSGAFGSGYHAVNTLALQSDGKILLGGYFTSYNGDAAAPDHLLRLKADGLLDGTFNSGSGTDDEVFSLVLQSDSRILAGGNFTSYNGVTAVTDRILRLNNITTADPGAGSKKTVSSLPATGFSPHSVTSLPAQPLEKAYVAYSDLQIEIPAIKLKIPIVGVPLTQNGWDVSWLGSNAGWLNGTAYPTWSGNSLITGHVWNATNQPGPFLHLKSLKYGDQVRIHAWGQIYIYEVRENLLVSPLSPDIALKHEKLAWVTLLTCEDYNNLLKTYSFRRMVRAVLVDVVPLQ